MIGFLVDHQDALIIKFIKDAGGTIDLVLRSIEDQQVVRTDAVTMDSPGGTVPLPLPQSVRVGERLARAATEEAPVMRT